MVKTRSHRGDQPAHEDLIALDIEAKGHGRKYVTKVQKVPSKSTKLPGISSSVSAMTSSVPAVATREEPIRRASTPTLPARISPKQVRRHSYDHAVHDARDKPLSQTPLTAPVIRILTEEEALREAPSPAPEQTSASVQREKEESMESEKSAESEVKCPDRPDSPYKGQPLPNTPDTDRSPLMIDSDMTPIEPPN